MVFESPAAERSTSTASKARNAPDPPPGMLMMMRDTKITIGGEWAYVV